jgi:DNA topoisomerase-3
VNKTLDISGVRVGAIVGAVAARVDVTQDEPPPCHTDASLLEDMLLAARHAENPADAAVLEATNGIGTARTRSEGIIDLIRNKSLARETRLVAGRQTTVVVMTEAGRRLEAALPVELKSVGLTAKWEMLCRRIERGEVTAESFIAVIRRFVAAVVADAKKRKASGRVATTPASVRQN